MPPSAWRLEAWTRQTRIVLKEATVDAAGKEVPAVMLAYGEFINALIQFVIIAFAIFLVVRAINRMRTPVAEAPAALAEEIVLLREIRDSLRR